MPIYPNPNPSFFPVIGNSFGDVMAQQRGWGLTNLDTQNQDIARRNAQDQARNSWLAQLAQLQRSDQATVQSALERDVGRESEAGQANIARGISAENTDYARRAAAAAAKEDRRRFDIQANLQEKALERTKAKEQDEMDQIKSAGEELAPQLADVGQKYQQSLKDYSNSIAKLDTAAANIASKAPVNEAGLPLTQYNPKARIFQVPQVMQGVPEAQKATTQANVELADQKSAFDSAKADHDTYASQLRDMEKTLGGYGLMQGSDYSVFSPRHKKRWGGIKTVDALPPPPVPDTFGPPPSPNFGMPDFGGMGSPAFFPASAPSANPIAPIRIGRFNVSPNG